MHRAVLWIALLAAPAAIAAEASPADVYVPEELQPWVEWVLHPHPNHQCPRGRLQGEAPCVWTRHVDVDVAADQLTFTLTTRLFAQANVTLPGNARFWPQDVRLNGTPVVVVKRGNRPEVRAEAGEHSISGVIRWRERPDGILIPRQFGLVSLLVDGEAITRPTVNNELLWFGEQPASDTPRERDIVELDVYRLLVDENPMVMQTHLQFLVGGRSRTETLGRVLLPDFEFTELDSALPARLDEDGNLKIQVEAGEFSVTVWSRATGQPSTLSMAGVTDNWPAQEIWAFDARRNLRLVNLSGAGGVDLDQVGSPFEGNLRGFLINPDTILQLETVQRGDPDPIPNDFSVTRDLWLNFDGSGLVVRDKLEATITRASRLSASYPLGRISVNDENQLVTAIAAGEPGIELQTGNYEIESVSALPSREALSAVGWNVNAATLNASLHMPPGWRLLWAEGVDAAPTAWIATWSLWDVFLLTLTLLLTWRFLSRGFAMVTALTLIIAYPEAPALGVAWLAIAALIAAQRAISPQRLRKLLRGSAVMLLLGTGLFTINFAIDHARLSLHPQLENAAADAALRYDAAVPIATLQMPRTEPLASRESIIEEVIVTGSRVPRYSSERRRQYPEGVQVQTGPGLPQWQWNIEPLRWFGPVSATQDISLTLLPPGAVRVLNALMAALALVVTAGFAFAQFGPSISWRPPPWLRMVLPSLLLLTILPTEQARGHGVDPDILKTLEQRLLEPPKCVPECAQIAGASLSLQNNQLEVTLRVHAAARVVTPLPGRLDGWMPAQVTRAGSPVSISRDQEGRLQAALEAGVHEIVMTGPVGELNRLDLVFPLNPGLVEVAVDASWQLQGLIDGRLPSGSISFERVVRATSPQPETLQQAPAAPFARLHRSIHFGLEWRVRTRVERLAPLRGAMTVQIPLLEGESVLNEALPIEDGNVVVAFDSNRSVVAWVSTIPQTTQLQLVAGDLAERTEVWELLPGNLWHVTHTGIVPSNAPESPGPVFHPHSAEVLDITAERTRPIAGPTVTVESVRLNISPGQRVQTADLRLVLRASEGGNYPVQLPDGAQITQVSVDGETQPIPLSDGEVALPILPGETTYDLSWRSESDGGLISNTPVLELSSPINNATLQTEFPRNRWVLSLGGPDLGPAVLFWGVLIVVALLGVAFSRIPTVPLTTLDALLLATGLTLCNLPSTLLVAAWFGVLLVRERWVEGTQKRYVKNGIQLLTGALSAIAVIALVVSVPLALLGSPEMQISGNGSSSYLYRWFQDHTNTSLPTAWVLSLPMWIYRAAMLAWSLWLAFALLRWVRWAWQRWATPVAWYSKLAV